MSRPTIAPALTYKDPAAALDWLARAFGFELTLCIKGDDGLVQHAEMAYGTGLIMVGGEGWATYPKSPKSVDGTNTQWLHVNVPDVEAHHERAVAADAEVIHELADQFYGDRTYRVKDPEGHVWSFGQTMKPIPYDELSAPGMHIEVPKKS